MDKIRNLSVRKTILLYMAAALLCSFFLSAVIVRTASRVQIRVWWNYVDVEAYFKAVESNGPDSVTDIPRPGRYEMTPSDHSVSEICDFLQTYTILILSMAGSCAAVFLFYRNKLQKPIEELALASKKIAGNHLDFNITYENKDEMGVLCREFERMREQLAVMKKGHFLYVGSMSELLEYAKGIVWEFVTADSVQARKLEEKYLISAKQYTENGIQMRVLSKEKPDVDCKPDSATLEDAYIYLTNQ